MLEFEAPYQSEFMFRVENVYSKLSDLGLSLAFLLVLFVLLLPLPLGLFSPLADDVYQLSICEHGGLMCRPDRLLLFLLTPLSQFLMERSRKLNLRCRHF